MRIQPPEPPISPDDPYFGDLFGLEEFATTLKTLFRGVDDRVVLCIEAPWGEGKTTFTRMLIEDLRKDNVNCIYYDAFVYDYINEPFFSFCGEIVDLIDSKFANHDGFQQLRDSFVMKAARLASGVAGMVARIAVEKGSLGLLSVDDCKELKDAYCGEDNPLINRMSDRFKRGLNDFSENKRTRSEFRELLRQLGAEVRKVQKGFPLLIVIDELDRCRPDFALALMESIKHLFSVDDVSFLITANLNQLENSVRSVYGSDIDAGKYLQKFITLTTGLPPIEDRCKTYCSHLLSHYIIQDPTPIRAVFEEFFMRFNFSLREMEKCLIHFAAYCSSGDRDGRVSLQLAAYFCIVQVRFRHLWRRLLNGDRSSDMIKETDLDKIDRLKRLCQLLQSSLLSQDEFDRLPQNSPLRGIRDSPHCFRDEFLSAQLRALTLFDVPCSQ